MALNIQSDNMPRFFKYNNQELPDPNPKMSPEEAMSFYTNTYPELTNANVFGPEIVDDKVVYEFKSTVGVKG
jgi:PRTRC genetic system protein C